MPVRGGSRVRLRAGALLACLVAAGLLVPAGAGGTAEVVGRLASKAPDVSSSLSAQLLLDPGARRLYELRPDSQAYQKVLLEVYDLDSLAHLRTVSVDDGQRQGALTSIVDEAHRRIFATYFKFPTQVVGEPWVAIIDETTLKVLGRYPLSEPSHGGQIYAMSYYAPEDKLYLLGEIVSPLVSPGDSGTNTTVLTQWDPKSGTADWTYPITSCQRPIGTNVSNGVPGPLGRSRTQNAVYLGCIVDTPVASYRFPGTPAAVRVNIIPGATQQQTNQFTTETFPIGGDFVAGVFDDVADRLFMVNKAFGAEGATAFDGRRNVFLGTIALNQAPSAVSIDPASGRLLFVDSTPTGGLTLADGRATPLPQGLFFRDIKSGRGSTPPMDPLTHRYFLKFWEGDVDSTKFDRRAYYNVVRDSAPIVTPPAPDDPDLATQNVAEREGVTEVNFSVGAQAFGARSLTVGGIGALQDNTIGVEAGKELHNNQTGIDRQLPVHPRLGDPAPPAPGDRDFFFGRVRKAFLSTGEASAQSIAVDRDGNTGGDLFHTSHPSGPNPDAGDETLTGDPQDLNKTGREVAWPYDDAECADFGDTPGTRTAPEQLGGTASVTCRKGAQEVSGTALTQETVTAGATLAGAYASGSVVKDRTRGAVATATAEAWGISVRDVLSVARVRTIATAGARGRPGTAGASFVRLVEGLRIMDPSAPGKTLFSCSSADECEPRLAEAAQTLFLASGGKIRIFFPAPDAELQQGTPGGYEALVRKDPNQFLEDKATNNDERHEVPGMVVVLFNDGHSRSRQIMQFAGVEAEAHYGIYVLPAYTSIDYPLPGIEIVPPVFVPPAAPPAAPPPPATVGGTKTILQRVKDGFTLAVTSPKDLFLALCVWAFFVAPLYLFIRRRQTLGALRRGGR